jgi:hypothetical protein
LYYIHNRSDQTVFLASSSLATAGSEMEILEKEKKFFLMKNIRNKWNLFTHAREK